MGLFDKVKNTTANLGEKTQNTIDAKLEEKEEAKQAAQIEKEKNQQLLSMFNASVELGDISIDMENRLFKVKHAAVSTPKKSSGLAKAGRAFMAVTTAGMSLAAEAMVKAAIKPEDKVFHFDALDSYELLEDDSITTGGGMGAAVAGGVLFGGVGAVAGSMSGKKSSKKTVDNMILQINTNDIAFPCIMVTYIKKSTKVNSKDYINALTLAKQSIRCLEMILEDEKKTTVENGDLQSSESATASNSGANNVDPVEQIKKFKELLDLGAITEEEFEAKKKELLNL